MARRKQVKKKYVLDTSVVVKWFVSRGEVYFDQAWRILQDYKARKISIIVPNFLIYELLNALRYNKSFKEKDVKKAVTAFLALGLSIKILTQDLLKETVAKSFQKDITFYDAIFPTLARHLKIKLITADDLQYRADSRNTIHLKNLYSETSLP